MITAFFFILVSRQFLLLLGFQNLKSASSDIVCFKFKPKHTQTTRKIKQTPNTKSNKIITKINKPLNQIKDIDEGLTSRDFYSTPKQTGLTIAWTIFLIVIIVAIFIIIIRLVSNFSGTGECATPPISPSNITVQIVTGTRFDVSWSSVQDATSYTIYVGQSPGFTRTQSINVTNAVETTAQIIGLDLNESYFIKVSSVNACGESENFAEIAFDFN